MQALEELEFEEVYGPQVYVSILKVHYDGAVCVVSPIASSYVRGHTTRQRNLEVDQSIRYSFASSS